MLPDGAHDSTAFDKLRPRACREELAEVQDAFFPERGPSALRLAQGPELSRGKAARCASTEDHQPPSLSPLLQRPERLFEEGFCEGHVLLDVRL